MNQDIAIDMNAPATAQGGSDENAPPVDEKTQALIEYKQKLAEHESFEAQVRNARQALVSLNKAFDQTEEDIKALQSVGQVIAEVVKPLDKERFIVKASSGPRYVVHARPTLPIARLTAGTRVSLDMTTLTMMRILPREVDPMVYNMTLEDPGSASFAAIGGLAEQIRELREVIELPILNPDLFERVGIRPPKGVLLFGPPGTGKTLLARAVAATLQVNFLKIVSSAIVDKYIGECFAQGTQIMLKNGFSKAVEDVKEGDVLVGDDGKERRVLWGSLVSGKKQLYRINCAGKQSWECTEQHLLVLKVDARDTVQDGRRLRLKQMTLEPATHVPEWTKDVIASAEDLTFECTVKEYLELPDDIQSVCRMFSPSTILEFTPSSRLNLSKQDIYNAAVAMFSGSCYMSGNSSSNTSSSPSKHILDIIEEFAMADELLESSTSRDVAFSNLSDNTPHVSHCVATGSVDTRQAFLDGILAARSVKVAYGHLVEGLPKVTLDQIAHLATSLGLAWSRENTSLSISAASQKHLVPFSVAASRKGQYFGFQVSGNKRFLLRDGTVTHNSARIVREIFQYAHDHEPCVIFMDEIDAIGGRRFSEGTSADREIQRTLMELLNQMDGFDGLGRTKVIMATNRPDTLDPALLRPGRLDRKIEIPLPNDTGRMEILKIHSKGMSKQGELDLEGVVKLSEGANGADLRNICTEAGMFAIREDRDVITDDDFKKGARKVMEAKKHESKLEYKTDL